MLLYIEATLLAVFSIVRWDERLIERIHSKIHWHHILTSAQFVPPYMTSVPGPANTAYAKQSCYTQTITLPDPRIRCSEFITSTCVPWQCFRAETETIPCPEKCCAKTPTVTSYKGCQTACSSGCPTVTVSCSKTIGWIWRRLDSGTNVVGEKVRKLWRKGNRTKLTSHTSNTISHCRCC